MLKLIVIVFCATLCLNGITAKHLSRRSNECTTDEASGYTCPQTDGMFPHQQCTKFWHCSNCLAYAKDCPSDLYWNDAKQECDWPANVPDSDCVPSSGEEASTTTQVPTETTTTTDAVTTGVTSETTTQESSDTTTEGSNDETTTQGSNEETTTEGSNQETTTQGSNEETTTQGSGEETTTEGSTDGTTTQTSSDETTTEAEADSTTSASTTTESSDDPSKPICKNNGQIQYYKHSQCNKFWQCGNGIAYEMTCASGTAWDDSLKTCNWPAAVNCQTFQKPL